MIAASAFVSDILTNKYNRQIIERMSSLNLNDTWLVAGCLFQTVWNIKSNLPPENGIDDYDIFYFDRDVSWEAEDVETKKSDSLFSDLPIKVDLKNQARVPIWYKEKKGHEYPPVTSARDNISRFLFCCNCVGVTNLNEKIDVYSPFGLEDIYEGILRPNHTVDSYITEGFREEKAKKYLSRWPWLKLLNN